MATVILMVRPRCFGFDPETATDNPFQQTGDGSASPAEIQAAALGEFDGVVATLRAEGIVVVAVEDSDDPPKPNAIFPNNWVSFHKPRKAIFYPMRTPSRRVERRPDILSVLAEEAGLQFGAVSDLVASENSGKYLEGTGSVVFDYDAQCAYACLSERTNAGVLADLGSILGDIYFHAFEAFDRHNRPIYHTNVMMCIAAKYAVICSSAIRDLESRAVILESLKAGGRVIIDISFDQMDSYCGNMLEVISRADQASKLVMSATAFEALTTEQKDQISAFSKIVPVPVATIEKYGGGSVRCMMCSVSQVV
jgi:hypothetical protein